MTVTTLKMIKCPSCGKRFRQRRETQRFDTAKCRLADWLAKHPRLSLEEKE